MCDYFSFSFRERETFLKLTFDEILKLVESDRLVGSEDEVLYSIFDWISYGDTILSTATPVQNLTEMKCDVHNSDTHEFQTQLIQHTLTANLSETGEINIIETNAEKINERKMYLLPLLKATRYSLASEACLVDLYRHKLTKSNIHVKDILFNASTFKFSNYLHGFWPTSAIHRYSSRSIHVGVMYLDKLIKAFSFNANQWYCVTGNTLSNIVAFTVFDKKLYASSTYKAKYGLKIKVSVLESNGWSDIRCDLPDYKHLLISHEKFIYLFYFNETKVYKFNPIEKGSNHQCFDHRLTTFEYALSHCRNIITFCSDKKDKEKTVVECWDGERNRWSSPLATINFSAKNMISFRNTEDTYILDCNGHLFLLSKSSVTEITFIEKLWSFCAHLQGAAIFKRTLFICGNNFSGPVDKQEIKGVFSTVQCVSQDGPISNFVYCVLDENKFYNPLSEKE